MQLDVCLSYPKFTSVWNASTINNFNDAYRRSLAKNKEINILRISLTQLNFVETHIDSFF